MISNVTIAVVFLVSLGMLFGHTARVGVIALLSRRAEGTIPATPELGELKPLAGNGKQATSPGAPATRPVITETKPASPVRTS